MGQTNLKSTSGELHIHRYDATVSILREDSDPFVWAERDKTFVNEWMWAYCLSAWNAVVFWLSAVCHVQFFIRILCKRFRMVRRPCSMSVVVFCGRHLNGWRPERDGVRCPDVDMRGNLTTSACLLRTMLHVVRLGDVNDWYLQISWLTVMFLSLNIYGRPGTVWKVGAMFSHRLIVISSSLSLCWLA